MDRRKEDKVRMREVFHMRTTDQGGSYRAMEPQYEREDGVSLDKDADERSGTDRRQHNKLADAELELQWQERFDGDEYDTQGTHAAIRLIIQVMERRK